MYGEDPTTMLRSDSAALASMRKQTFFVVRSEDQDEMGHNLVGVESGPYDTLEAAMFNLDVVPNYGPTRMSDELILLTRDAVAWHNNDAASKARDGCCRFIIRGEDREHAIAQFGVWDLDIARVEAAVVADQGMSPFRGLGRGGMHSIGHGAEGGEQLRPTYAQALNLTHNHLDGDMGGAGRAGGPIPWGAAGGRTGGGRLGGGTGVGGEMAMSIDGCDAGAGGMDAALGDMEDAIKDFVRGAKPVRVDHQWAPQRASQQFGGAAGKDPHDAEEAEAAGGGRDRAQDRNRERSKDPPSRERLREKEPQQRERERETQKEGATGVEKKTTGVSAAATGGATGGADGGGGGATNGQRRQSRGAVDFDVEGIPFVKARVIGASTSGVDRLASVESEKEDRFGSPWEDSVYKIFHTLRGQVMAGGMKQSKSTPSKPPPPASNTQFQLATESNPYHLLAIRCSPKTSNNKKEQDGNKEKAMDFAIVMDDRGYVFVSSKGEQPQQQQQQHKGDRGAGGEAGGVNDGFELLMQFPRPVNELSAQSVYKEGVLFVIAPPRKPNLVNVRVELDYGSQVGVSAGGSSGPGASQDAQAPQQAAGAGRGGGGGGRRPEGGAGGGGGRRPEGGAGGGAASERGGGE